jgi:hypothetical protein
MRRVNDVTVPDAYRIPIMTSVLDNVGEAKYISTIDFTKSYYQVPLATDSRPKTEFSFLTEDSFNLLWFLLVQLIQDLDLCVAQTNYF